MGTGPAGDLMALPYRLGRSALGAVWGVAVPVVEAAVRSVLGGQDGDDRPVPGHAPARADAFDPGPPTPRPTVPPRGRTRHAAHDQRVSEDRRAARERRRDIEPDPASDGPPSDPAHVSDDASLVATTADPGVPADAGPSLHVEEPWEGYAGMRVRDVVARLSSATIAELAAVRLYEQDNRARRTVLEAVDRALDRLR